jgi:hypothetical protein
LDVLPLNVTVVVPLLLADEELLDEAKAKLPPVATAPPLTDAEAARALPPANMESAAAAMMIFFT